MNASVAHNSSFKWIGGHQCDDVTEGQGDLVGGHLMSQIHLPLMHPGGAVSLQPASECTTSFNMNF